jgi:hypothetical protein
MVTIAVVLAACAPAAWAQRLGEPSGGGAAARRAEADDFDFFVGRWTLTDPQGRPQGTDVVKRYRNDVAIMEKYNPPSGPQGASANVFDFETGLWTQTYRQDTFLLQVTGGMVGDEMVLEGPFTDPSDGRRKLARLIFRNITNRSFEQAIDVSTDGGATWTTLGVTIWQRMR